MIDQKIIMVDARGIIGELAMALLSQDFARDFATVGRFMDENSSALSSLIVDFYLNQLSRGIAASDQKINQQIQLIVTRDLCRYFPNMNAIQMRSAMEMIYNVLGNGFYQRRGPVDEVWDQYETKELNLDTYAIICRRQTSAPISRFVERRLSNNAVNSPGY